VKFWLEQAIACDEGLPPIVRARSRSDAGYQRAIHGDHAGAEPLIAEALQLARACGDPYLLADALIGAGLLAKRQGDLTRAMAYNEEAERVARAISPDVPNAGQLVGGALSALADIARLSGDHALAITRHEEAVRLQRAFGARWFLSLALVDLGLTQVCADDPIGATPHLLEAMALAWGMQAGAVITLERGEDIFFTEDLRGMAAVAAGTGQPAAAAQLLGAADSLDTFNPFAAGADWRTQEPLAWISAHLADSLDPLALTELRRAGVGLTIAQAVALAREVAAAVLGAARVEEIWRVAGAPETGPAPAPPVLASDDTPAAPAAAMAALTFREQDVLALLCQRLTDAEIAARLFLSPRTVSRHVGSILGKLGAANRREAAAIAVRQHLI
jgi:DNA-binding CsgD family transcriptional regulator